MKIAVIGTGNVGGTLGSRWAQNGHRVIFGSRNPGRPKVQELVQRAGANAHATSVSEAVAQSEVVVLATPWNATQEIIQSAGDLQGKVVVDCTNPLAEGLRGLSVGHTISGGELVAEWAVGVRVVKAFNSTGAGNMANPLYDGVAVSMFICGDDADAKAIVSELVSELGFEVVDTGALATARYLEPLAMLWIHLAYVEGYGPDIAFKLLKR